MHDVSEVGLRLPSSSFFPGFGRKASFGMPPGCEIFSFLPAFVLSILWVLRFIYHQSFRAVYFVTPSAPGDKQVRSFCSAGHTSDSSISSSGSGLLSSFIFQALHFPWCRCNRARSHPLDSHFIEHFRVLSLQMFLICGVLLLLGSSTCLAKYIYLLSPSFPLIWSQVWPHCFLVRVHAYSTSSASQATSIFKVCRNQFCRAWYTSHIYRGPTVSVSSYVGTLWSPCPSQGC